MNTDAEHTGIVYWRRSRWNGARCEPVLVSLVPGALWAGDRALAVVFEADPRTVTGRLTRLGTLLLTVDGRRYDLVGRGSSASPGPSAGQEQALADFAQRRGPCVPAVAGGAVDQLFNGGAAGRMRAWHQLLRAAGAQVQ
ncbi:hypothetical protein ACH4UM_25700 [Streptomyces sp. NPDC020801]|uniref:hypothetical protein n=1 Tax=unclassified Streptomyces TaxID=2593676 RepID=UPI0037ACF729